MELREEENLKAAIVCSNFEKGEAVGEVRLVVKDAAAAATGVIGGTVESVALRIEFLAFAVCVSVGNVNSALCENDRHSLEDTWPIRVRTVIELLWFSVETVHGSAAVKSNISNISNR